MADDTFRADFAELVRRLHDVVLLVVPVADGHRPEMLLGEVGWSV